MATAGMFDGLSVDAVAGARTGKSTEKAQQQAEANVARQQATAALRRQSMPMKAPEAPAPSPAAASSAKKAPAKPDDKAIKEVARKATMISKYLTSPHLSPYLQGIVPPSSQTPEQQDFVLEQIRERLNSGLGPTVVASLWLKGMTLLEQPLTQLPDKARIPPGSHNYAAMRMGELSMEFEMLSIEYDYLFASGPIPRILMKSMGILLDYKQKVESGEMPMLIPESFPAEEAVAMHNDQAATSEPPQPVERDVPRVPPSMKIYPDPVEEAAAPDFIHMEPLAEDPRRHEPSPSKPVFSSDVPSSSSSSGSVARGRGKKRGGV